MPRSLTTASPNSVLYLSDSQSPYTINFALEGALTLGIPLILS